MKKSTKKYLINTITIAIVLILIIVLIVLKNKPGNTTTEEIAKCIGEKSELYTQLGCSACETQEQMFGENYQYLTKIDCFYERDKCSDITATPTWKIKNQDYQGVQTIEKLQELTGC
jgi:hypothetical protein